MFSILERNCEKRKVRFHLLRHTMQRPPIQLDLSKIKIFSTSKMLFCF